MTFLWSVCIQPWTDEQSTSHVFAGIHLNAAVPALIINGYHKTNKNNGEPTHTCSADDCLHAYSSITHNRFCQDGKWKKTRAASCGVSSCNVISWSLCVFIPLQLQTNQPGAWDLFTLFFRSWFSAWLSFAGGEL